MLTSTGPMMGQRSEGAVAKNSGSSARAATLPQSHPAPAASSTPMPEGRPERVFPQPYPLRVMVVDDTPSNLTLALRMLGHLGYTADTATNGQECVDAVTRKQYDLLLIDLQMPVLDGLAATRQIRRWSENHPATPAPLVCALTANTMAPDREACRAVGMDDFLPKPLRLEALRKLMNRVADRVRDLEQGAAALSPSPLP